MEQREYEMMYKNEDNHWWYWGLRDLVLKVLKRSAKGRETSVILDAGCGTGKHLQALSAAGIRAVGLELAPEAFRFLSLRGLSKVTRASVCRIPFAKDSFDAVISTDVLCCLQPPGDCAAARELARVLKPGGALLLNLPAYESLRGRHDDAVHTRQRFTRQALIRLLDQAGLHVQSATYRNTLLFPVVSLVRLLGKVRREPDASPHSDVFPLPDPINRLLKVPLSLENHWIRLGGRLPFGLSVFCVATKGKENRYPPELANPIS
jgi:SAM-dependent methyltransferase